MRFFKYLILIILSLITSTVFAGFRAGAGTCSETKEAACKSALSADPPSSSGRIATKVESNGDYCDFFTDAGIQVSSSKVIDCTPPVECPPQGYPSYYYFSSGGKVPTTTCTQMPGGQYCVFRAGANPIILNHENDRQSVTLYSVSSTPVSSCTPLFDNECNKNDPYGKCYQPPNDGCTRQADGSIICPDNIKPPTPEEQCKGADYCNRPPNGCPEGYVSGSFNGQALCVKSSPSTGGPTTGDGDGSGSGGDGSGTGSGGDGDGSGDGSGSGGDGSGTGSGDGSGSGSGSGGDGSGTGGDGSGSGSGTDLSGVIGAINSAKNAITAAVNTVSTKVDNLVKGQKETNEKLNNIDQNGKQTNEKLDQLNGTAGETKGLIQEIKDWLTGEPTEDPGTEVPTRELDGQKSFSESLISTGSQSCPNDFQIDWDTPFGHISKTISYQELCSKTAWFGYLVLAASYYLGALIVMRDS